MRGLMDRVFARYGTEVTVENGQTSYKVKVFFQSINSKSWQNMEKMYHLMGQIPRGQYLCLFPAGTAVKAGDFVEKDNVLYTVCRVEDMAAPAATVYRWALCVQKGSEYAWG